MHIIFGRKDSSDSTPRLRKKGDLFYSESNYNFFVTREGQKLDLGGFISILNFGASGRLELTMYVLESELSLCGACQESTRVPCALFQNPKAKPPPDASISEFAKAVVWPKGSSEPLSLCPIVQKLVAMTETQAERRFY